MGKRQATFMSMPDAPLLLHVDLALTCPEVNWIGLPPLSLPVLISGPCIISETPNF